MEKLDRELIYSYLEKYGNKIPDIFVHENIDSTNNEAKRLAQNGISRYAIILAEEQSGGRGRMGRSFFSPYGTGLYFTLLFESPDEVSAKLRLTTVAAVALLRAIRSVYSIETGIKWVNDIYLDGSKVAGILAESFDGCFGEDSVRMTALGIGVNICTEKFPDELTLKAGSLCRIEEGRNLLAAEITKNFFDLLDDVRDGDCSYMEEYRAASLCIGKKFALPRRVRVKRRLLHLWIIWVFYMLSLTTEACECCQRERYR